MKKNRDFILAVIILSGILAGACQHPDLLLKQSDAALQEEKPLKKEPSDSVKTKADPEKTIQKQTKTQSDQHKQSQTKQEPQILDFVDAFGEAYQVKINPEIKKHDYKLDAFVHDGDRLSYNGDERYSYRLGIDVSYHNGEIDWEKVKAEGYEFAFLRIGYRGYGKEGRICLDKQFYNYIQNARAAGLDIGVYFFSQAVSEEEAAQEAAFVLQTLDGIKLQLPVVYDPESILDAEARTDHVTGSQFTKNTIVFCEQIEKAGYQPMIYSNMLWEAYQFDLEKLAKYPVWYADYESLPQTPYAFDYWQYSNEGMVDGIAGAVDLDIQFIRNQEIR